MTTAALVGLVVLLAVSFWAPLRNVRRMLGIAHLVASGYAFLVLGGVVGLAAGGESARPLVRDLGPIVAFAAGWVGFASGSRFEYRVLRTVPATAYLRALAPALAAAAAVGAASAALLVLAGAPLPQAIAGALCLAAAAASTGPTLAAVLRTQRARRSRDAAAMLRMIEFSSGISDGLVVILAVLAFALVRTGAEPSPPAVILLVAAGGGGVLGLALWLFLGGRASDDERMLLGLGMLAMIAGFGAWLEVAPAGIAAIAGAAAANLPGGRSEILIRAVRRVERPVVVILMAVIGLYIADARTGYIAALVGVMTAVRLGAKLVAGGPPRAALPGAPNLGAPRGWALGLAPQGILGLVVALGFFQVWRDDVGLAVLGAAAFGGLINEILGPLLLLRVLRRTAGGGEEAR